MDSVPSPFPTDLTRVSGDVRHPVRKSNGKSVDGMGPMITHVRDNPTPWTSSVTSPLSPLPFLIQSGILSECGVRRVVGRLP